MYSTILFCDAIYVLLSGNVYKTSETPFFVLPSFDAQKVYFHTQKVQYRSNERRQRRRSSRHTKDK